jgi:hypothetical protein
MGGESGKVKGRVSAQSGSNRLDRLLVHCYRTNFRLAHEQI